MHEVFIEIIPRGILPALRVSNFWLKKTGILDVKDGSVCLKCSNAEIWECSSLDAQDFGVLCEICRACTGQDYFQLLCTSILEVILFGMVSTITRREGYVSLLPSAEFYDLTFVSDPDHFLTHASEGFF